MTAPIGTLCRDGTIDKAPTDLLNTIESGGEQIDGVLTYVMRKDGQMELRLYGQLSLSALAFLSVLTIGKTYDAMKLTESNPK